MNAFYRETERCIRCFGKVEFYTGHVKLDDETIIAGWCRRCYDGEKYVEGGYRGKWTAQMGLIGSRHRPGDLPAPQEQAVATSGPEPSCKCGHSGCPSCDPPPAEAAPAENPYAKDPDLERPLTVAAIKARQIMGQRQPLAELPLPSYYPER